MTISTFLRWLLPQDVKGQFWNVKENLDTVLYEELHSKLWGIIEGWNIRRSEILLVLPLTGKNIIILSCFFDPCLLLKFAYITKLVVDQEITYIFRMLLL